MIRLRYSDTDCEEAFAVMRSEESGKAILECQSG